MTKYDWREKHLTRVLCENKVGTNLDSFQPHRDKASTKKTCILLIGEYPPPPI